MATPPDPPKTPVKTAKAATPAPRRSTRKATTPKPAKPRAAPATSEAATAKAPAAAKPVAKRSVTRKAVAPAPAPTPKAKAAPKPKTQPAITKAARKPVAKLVTTARKSLAAVPPVKPKTAWSLGAVALAAGAGIAAFLSRGRIMALLTGKSAEGHVPTDLLDPTRNADDRAVADFRPDMDAVMSAAEREALRPPPGLPN